MTCWPCADGRHQHCTGASLLRAMAAYCACGDRCHDPDPTSTVSVAAQLAQLVVRQQREADDG